MVQDIKFGLTNWVDGMKLHRAHFINSENALLSLIRDSSAQSITPFNFGLLPQGAGNRTALNLTIQTVAEDTVTIEIHTCSAVTEGGERIDVQPGEANKVTLTQKINWHASITTIAGKPAAQNVALYVILNIDPFNRQPTGLPDQEEEPKRHPSIRAGYIINIIAADQLNFNQFNPCALPVARLVRRSGALFADETYIPPCTTITAAAALAQIFYNISSLLGIIQQCCTLIVKKVTANSEKSVSPSIKKLALANVHYIMGNDFALNNLYKHAAPLYLVNFVVQLAAATKMELVFMSEREKEDMLSYFKDWNEMTNAAFEEMLDETIAVSYDHYNLAEAFEPLEYFLKTWADLLQKISVLDPIGKVKIKDTTVRQNTFAEEPKIKKSLIIGR